jgi:c-di-GMP-binding flagellar brake protein YcgR
MENPLPAQRRRAKRISVRIPARVYLADNPKQIFEGEILDLSEGGAFVSCRSTFSLGGQIVVEILFDQAKLIQGVVVVWEKVEEPILPPQLCEPSVIRWSNPQNTGFGVEFIDMPEEKKQFLRELVAYFEKLKRAGANFE